MKTILTYLFFLTVLISKADYWTQKANLPSTTRAFVTGFSLGDKGYFATGAVNPGFSQELWEYDPPTNSWTQKANFPGTGRWNAGGFAIGTKAYLGTGSITINWFNDFWEYDQSTNLWTQKANFPGSIRDGARGFAIGTKGYFGAGWNNVGFNYTWFKDFYEYDPITNAWTQKADYGGPAIRNGVAFSIGNKGYMGTGEPNGPKSKEFWEYDPVTNSWTQKADFGGTARDFASGFVIGSNGYLGTGNGIGYLQDFWQYSSLTNSWIQKANFGGAGRYGTAAFSVGNKGYMGAGVTPGSTTTYYNDLWEYTPDTTTSINEVDNSRISMEIFPNPFFNIINISTKCYETFEIVLYNSSLDKILQQKFINSVSLNTEQLVAGVYIYELCNKNGFSKKGKVVKY